MNKRVLLCFFILGITSVASQVILFRELIVSFYGNEFFTSLILASWLFWIAMGSYLLAKIFSRFKDPFKILIACLLLIPFVLFCEIILIRFLGGQTDVPGEIPNLIYSLITAILIPAPLCLILGLQFTVGTRTLLKYEKNKKTPLPAPMISRAYFLETLGFILGGIIFSYFLVRLNEFQALAFIACLNLGSCVLILNFGPKNRSLLKITNISLLLIFILSGLSFFSQTLNKSSASLRFKKQQLIESLNSVHGNIAVTRANKQYNFYESGLLMGSVQESGLSQADVFLFDEEMAHLSLLSHSWPRKVLLIGRGLPGLIPEMLKHPVQELYYLELDAQLIETIKNYLPLEIKQYLSDEKVNMITTDARYFLNTTQEQFDVIIVNLPNPSTVLLNRFYTREFFAQIKNKLKPEGIVVTSLGFSPTQPAKDLENLNASLYQTLQQVFPYLILLPEDNNFFLASSQNILSQNPDILIQRYQERGLQNSFVTKDYINYRLTSDRIPRVLNDLKTNQKAIINQDFKPVSYFYSILFWMSIFYPRLSAFFRVFSPLFVWLILGAILFLGFLVIFSRLKTRGANTSIVPYLSMAMAGFGLMAQEMIIIFAYQIACGYLYYRVALLMAAIMLGMAMGTFWGRKKLKVKLITLHLFLASSLLTSILVLKLLSQFSLEFWQKELIFLLLSILAGFFPGMIFPLANKIYLENQKEPNKKTGMIYSADLMGSSLGALLSGIILIPILGAYQVLILLLISNLWLIGLLLFGFKNLGRKSV